MGATSYQFGGVDSRSNSLNMPVDRALRCRNWIPQQSGVLRLRDGYKATKDSGTAAAIHSLTDYRYNGVQYVIFVQGTSVKSLNLSTLNIASQGSMSSSADCYFARSDGKLFIANGVDFKYFDGVTLRNVGLRAGASSDVSSANVIELLRQPSSSEGGAVAIVDNAGGSFAATAAGGYLWHLHYVDTSNSISFGPYYQVGSRMRLTSGSRKFDFSSLPNISAVNANWVKVLSRTDDGTGIAKFAASASCSVTNISFNAALAQMTVTAAAHGFSSGDVVEVTAPGWEGVFTIASTTVNSFVYGDVVHSVSLGATGAITATFYKLVTVAPATTTVSVTSTLTGSMQANIDVGVAASAFSGSSAGYLGYVSVYNATTGHIGTRIKIEGRFKPGTAGTRAIFYIRSLGNIQASNSEWLWLVGRTADNSEVPYAIADTAGNWRTSNDFFVLRDALIDTATELPASNTVPTGLTQIIKAGGRLYAIKGDEFVYHSPDSGNPAFVGKAEQSWPANNYEGFPTGENVVAIAEYEQQCVAFSSNFCGLLIDEQGVLGWQGPWAVGIAGKKAFTKTPIS